ncbi:ATP-binding protein [Streptomyces sp. NBC_01537]|uniref:ATP-binding protein n=1 Tax=Streptomyces sp. NBC_01537 TaxID=2903896 RepID=UPI00386A2135
MKPEVITPAACFRHLFSATRRGARLARHLTVHQLDEWGMAYGSDCSDRAEAIVAELAANAVTHGYVPGRSFEVRLTLTPRLLRIDVADARTESWPWPAAQPPSAEVESGRGLLLVDALSDRWSVLDRGAAPGKTVRAELDLGPGRL